jgi:hypothetical protein
MIVSLNELCEWVGSYGLIPNEQFFNYFMTRAKYIWWDDDMRFLPDQRVWLDFYSVSSLQQQSADRHVATLGHIILIPSQPIFALSP